MANDNMLKLESPWAEVRERIMESEISLTKEDLQLDPGQDQQLLDRLAKKLNKTPDSVKGWIESLSANTAQAG